MSDNLQLGRREVESLHRGYLRAKVQKISETAVTNSEESDIAKYLIMLRSNLSSKTLVFLHRVPLFSSCTSELELKVFSTSKY